MDQADGSEPVCIIGLQVHILTAGATFNLHTREASPGRCCCARTERDPTTTVTPPSGGPMRILNRNVYVGPRSTRSSPVIRLELDLGALEQWPTARLGDVFIDGLVAALPGLAEHGCSYREPGGFIRRMREGEGTWLGHVLEHVASSCRTSPART